MQHTLLIAATLSGILALTGCNRQAPSQTGHIPPPATTPEVVTPAVQVTDVRLGTNINEDQHISNPVTRFAPEDQHLIAAVSMATSSLDSPASGTLGARWSYQDGQLVDERSTSFFFTGDDTTAFHISNPDGWPTGDYTVDISIDGEVVDSLGFTVE